MVEEIENLEEKLCDYGCGKIARFKFKNGKLCCSNNIAKCNKFKQFGIEPFNKGKKDSNETREKKRAANIKKRKWSKGLTKNTSELVKNMSIKLTGRKLSEDHIKKLLGRVPWNKNIKDCFSDESRLKISKNNKGKHKNTEEFKQRMREKLLNGQSLIMIKSIKKISKEELKLKSLVDKLYNRVIPQYRVLNYSIDIAIPEHKIAIEYDGYYHFDCKENIEYHKQRRERIENEGWKFYKVTMFDEFPTIEKVKENVDLLIGLKN